MTPEPDATYATRLVDAWGHSPCDIPLGTIMAASGAGLDEIGATLGLPRAGVRSDPFGDAVRAAQAREEAVPAYRRDDFTSPDFDRAGAWLRAMGGEG